MFELREATYADARASAKALDIPVGTLALAVGPIEVDKDTPMMRPVQGPGPVAGCAWACRDLSCGIVGTRKAKTLHRLADGMGRQTDAILRIE